MVSVDVRPTERGISQIDEMMDRASEALVENRYFEAASLARRSLARARQALDFERMARICLPLQESTRQIRLTATDAAARAAQANGHAVTVAMSASDLSGQLIAGCVLLQPPLIGADGRSLRMAAERTRSPLLVLTREPLTRTGQWPIVGLGRVAIRTKVDPPFELPRDEGTQRKDLYAGDPPLPLSWFESAHEALGDAAIEMDAKNRHPWWRVDDALERLDVVPDHEKLHQHVAALCREAAAASPPDESRRPSAMDDPAGF